MRKCHILFVVRQKIKVALFETPILTFIRLAFGKETVCELLHCLTT